MISVCLKNGVYFASICLRSLYTANWHVVNLGCKSHPATLGETAGDKGSGPTYRFKEDKVAELPMFGEVTKDLTGKQ